MSEIRRYRKKLTVTIDPDTLNVINAIASNKGAFVDECVRAYMTGEHFYWVTLKYGIVHISNQRGFYDVKQFDNEPLSPSFSSMFDCLEWLKKECPEVKL